MWGAAPGEGDDHLLHPPPPQQGGEGCAPLGGVGAAVAVRAGQGLRQGSLWRGGVMVVVVSEGVTDVRRTPLGAFLRGPPSSVMVGGCNINPCQEQGGFGWPSPCFNVTFWHCCFLYLLPPPAFRDTSGLW